MTVATACYHCGLPVARKGAYFARVDGQRHPVCCPGCQAVAEAIADSGLSSYYRTRTTFAPRAETQGPEQGAGLAIYDQARSYVLAGAVAGTVGSLGLMLDGVLPVQIALYAAANLVLIGLGLYLAGIRGPVSRLERLGSRLWSLLRPFTRRFLPANSPAKALALGMLWGWLPCGLVYTMLFTALLSGNTLSGATVMLAFGLGTLPNLMAAAALLHGPRAWLASRPARALSGAVVLAFGVYGLAHAATLSQQVKGGLFCMGG